MPTVGKGLRRAAVVPLLVAVLAGCGTHDSGEGSPPAPGRPPAPPAPGRFHPAPAPPRSCPEPGGVAGRPRPIVAPAGCESPSMNGAALGATRAPAR
ncbi:MAG TPA: hypothetical protein VHA75_19865 [Rugosimonospora sp.]|nr:hypothetical protein [Rugosimonospora sp.]